MFIDELIRSASKALTAERFDEARAMLSEALTQPLLDDEKELIIQELVHLYSHPKNLNFGAAEDYLEERDRRWPSSYSAYSAACFYCYIKNDLHAANQWGQMSYDRSLAERNPFTQFSSNIIIGVSAVGLRLESVVSLALDVIEEFSMGAEKVPFGDAVVFLESISNSLSSGALVARARRIAKLIAHRIPETDFRTRAENLASA